MARRYRITTPEQVRDEAGISIGDIVDVRSRDGKVIIEKVGRDSESVMNEAKGSWKSHPTFKSKKDAVEIVD